MQEDVHDEDNQDKGDDEGFNNAVDGGVKEVVGGLHLLELQACRQGLRHFLYHLVDFLVDRGGIGARGLFDEERRARVSVDVGAVVVRLSTQLHIGHVSQAHDFTIRGGAHDDLLELAHVVQLSVELNVNLVDRAFNASHRRHQVLLVDGIDDFILGDAVAGHHIRLHPDTHTVGVAKELGATYARDAADTRQHVDVQIVVDKLLVKPVVSTLQSHDLQDGVNAFTHGDTVLGHIGRQQALGLVHAVVDVDGGLVGIGALLEIHVDFDRAIGECR